MQMAMQIELATRLTSEVSWLDCKKRKKGKHTIKHMRTGKSSARKMSKTAAGCRLVNLSTECECHIHCTL